VILAKPTADTLRPQVFVFRRRAKPLGVRRCRILKMCHSILRSGVSPAHSDIRCSKVLLVIDVILTELDKCDRRYGVMISLCVLSSFAGGFSASKFNQNGVGLSVQGESMYP
jgi:hypothetical protein